MHNQQELTILLDFCSLVGSDVAGRGIWYHFLSLLERSSSQQGPLLSGVVAQLVSGWSFAVVVCLGIGIGGSGCQLIYPSH